MIFTTNTKPLADSLSLGVVDANVSKFYSKSCMAQVTAKGHDLIINLEANSIKSEIRLKGSSDVEGEAHRALIDSKLFKQLVGTFDTSAVKLEFTDGGIILHSGSSKFTLPNMIDVDDLSLDAPQMPENAGTAIDIDKSDWRFIKDNQMYAVAMSFIHPVYTMAWIGESGDVIVGDMDNGIFTNSKKGQLGTTCLLSDTIINLFNALPEGAKLFRGDDRSYIVSISTDAYQMMSQFTPKYEDDAEVGSYSAEIVLGLMQKPDSTVKVSTSAITRLLSQAALLSTSSDDKVMFTYEPLTGAITLSDSKTTGDIKCTGEMTKMSIPFKTSTLKQVIGNYSDETIEIGPTYNGDDIVGIVVWTPELTTVLAGVDE